MYYIFYAKPNRKFSTECRFSIIIYSSLLLQNIDKASVSHTLRYVQHIPNTIIGSSFHLLVYGCTNFFLFSFFFVCWLSCHSFRYFPFAYTCEFPLFFFQNVFFFIFASLNFEWTKCCVGFITSCTLMIVECFVEASSMAKFIVSLSSILTDILSIFFPFNDVIMCRIRVEYALTPARHYFQCCNSHSD